MKITKHLLIPAALAGALALAGCSATSASSSSGAAAAGSEAPAAAEPAQETEQTQAASSKYAVTIDGARLGEDYAGNPVVIVTFTFTNNSDDKANFTFACNADAYQNGVELDTAIVTDIESNGLNDIKPGASIQTELAYELNDMSDIEVEVTELLSFSDDLLAYKTFTLQ